MPTPQNHFFAIVDQQQCIPQPRVNAFSLYNKIVRTKDIMFYASQQSHYQFILRSSQEIERERKKYSATYKRRNKNDRHRQRQKFNTKLLHYQSEEIRKRNNQISFQLQTNNKLFNLPIQQNNVKFLSCRKTPGLESARKRNSQFSIIMENFKDILSSNEKQFKEPSQFKNKFNLKDQSLCLRTGLPQQIYKAEPRNDHFRSKEIEQSIIQMKRYTRHVTTNNSRKYVCNPFMNSKTVMCNSAVLNAPLTLRKPPQLETNPTQTISKSLNARKSIVLSNSTPKKVMGFQLNSDGDQNYLKKIKSYLDFLFKVNFSNNIYVNLDLNYEQSSMLKRYRVYIGKGNNSQLVKSLIKRRFWWEIVNSPEDKDIHFFWTQSKLDKVMSTQKTYKQLKSSYLDTNKKIIKLTQEALSLNKRILSLQKSNVVQQFINYDGFVIPFEESYTADIMTNHLQKNNSIGSKKNLFKSLNHYYKNIVNKNPFDFIPKTYHVHSREGEQFKRFVKQNESEPNKIWIIKPGQNTNRGNSIQLAPFNKIEQCMTKDKHPNGDPFTYIIQSYINKPFLYNNRKFDIRHYLLLTSVNGLLKGYWYKEGYIRTSSQAFQLQDLSNKFIHLTNDAIQKYCQSYEKYETANKLSYNEFQRHLDYNFPNKNYNFQRDIVSKMKEMTLDIIKANYLIIDQKRLKNNFQIFGLDFMIDRQWKPWLIEVNYNPCLQVNCPVLQRVIPAMLENTFRVALDPIYPPPCHFPSGKRFYLSDNYLKNLKYQLIFDEESLKTQIKNTYIYEDEQEQEEEFQDEGHELNHIHM